MCGKCSGQTCNNTAPALLDIDEEKTAPTSLDTDDEDASDNHTCNT